MEQPSSSSKVTVEYFDPHDVYKLLAPGLIPRLPLRDLNWQSHAGPVRSIHTLHVEIVPTGTDYSQLLSPLTPNHPQLAPPSVTVAANAAGTPNPTAPAESPAIRDDGFQNTPVGGRSASIEQTETMGPTLRPPGAAVPKERRHQIPGLRRTPYLKILLVRCDDNDTYKSTTRAEVREWLKENTPVSQGKLVNNAENHDAFEWMIIHVVLPNTVAATQPRMTGGKAPDSSSDITKTAASRWRGGSNTLLEKMRSDFNSSSKNAVDRVRQIRIGINDVPYDLLPRVVPAVPTGYQETEQDSENAWADLIGKIKELILSSFDTRVTQYEEDIKERDGQRSLPGWNFCTFFILKEGLARGFESVGLVEDALVVYDELSVGLDAIIQAQAIAGSAEAHGGALLPYTEELKKAAQRAMRHISRGNMEFDDEEAVDLQSSEKGRADLFDRIPISATRKQYRELILANNVSLFDFRCYIFARQMSLLLRLGNASSTREELLAKLRELQGLVPRGVAPRAPPPKVTDESENLLHLAEICRRTLEFVPAVSQVSRRDLMSALASAKRGEGAGDAEPAVVDPILSEVVDNIVASFAFSVAQQILAQTSTKALPIPPSTFPEPGGQEPKASIPEPKTMIHPARSTSLYVRAGQNPPLSPIGFPSPGRRSSLPEGDAATPYLKAGLEELAARRAELYALSRNILEECGKKRGWSDGWSSVPVVGESGVADMEDISLDDGENKKEPTPESNVRPPASIAGLDNELLRTALDNKDDFYRLYETLTDKSLRHYTVASHDHSVQANMADLAVLKFHLGEFGEAAFYFYRVIPFFGEGGWSLLELSMLVMYARCLKKLQRMDDYVNKALRQLLSKAAAAELERLQQKSRFRVAEKAKKQFPEASAISGFLTDLLTVSATLDQDVTIPLVSFFGNVELDGPPVYDDNQDSFSLFLKLHSLVVDEFEADTISLRITSPSAGGNREIWLQAKGPVTIKPGRNKVELQSTAMMAGNYEVDEIRLSSSNMRLHYERTVGEPVDKLSTVLRSPRVTLHQRTSTLNARLTATKDIQLDKNNSLDLEVLTGWNTVTSCEVKIKAATGGLRLLIAETVALGPFQLLKRSEGGSFTFGAVPANESVRLRFPFTVEHELLTVAIKVEVAYSTDRGSFTFSRTLSVPIALELAVNVQDVFKHDALFSRFTVSTASASPLRMFKSELVGSEIFESHFGMPPSHPIVVFPKQPASLLYKITRKPGSKLAPKAKRTLYLRIYYSVLSQEIEALFERTLNEDIGKTPLREYSKLVVAQVLSWVKTGLSPYELEKAALLGELQTAMLGDVKWDKQFPGFESTLGPQGESLPTELASFVLDWLKTHPKLLLPHPEPASVQPNSIIIPVDIPPITIVHTADIDITPKHIDQSANSQVQDPLGSLTDNEGHPTVCINQLLPATLHLRWTRRWDTSGAESVQGKTVPIARSRDLEFGYEITAPADTWLLGGRRKGHFVIPAMSDLENDADLTSTPETEADIPLLLVPLREGWLPYPSVEIREVRGSIGGEEDGQGLSIGHGHCETDYRNLGETINVIADRSRVTLSLDASGLGGGPLVLESERSGLGGGRAVV
ncbi:trafficking protein particle complex subunit 10 [Lasiosphaeria ovina]|uniref:Trafficking protein particle complex subunit 10 n=1 Tax=Lasiosphaeria ovina TaxID=92902 RepID=A0AAE0KIH8_9PEZI|nr:trafficking protein particle complex subunit 10 [Lasiosphaeria ovina]